jgi:hypothetical protein
MADLCFTGPPFFASDRLLRMDVPALADTYEAYLADLQLVFSAIRERLRPGAYVVAQFANLVVDQGFRSADSPGGLMPLAWDAARAIDRLMPLVREEIWCIAPASDQRRLRDGTAISDLPQTSVATASNNAGADAGRTLGVGLAIISNLKAVADDERRYTYGDLPPLRSAQPPSVFPSA